MILNEVIDHLIALRNMNPKAGLMEVFTVQGLSGDVNEVGSVSVSKAIGDRGWFDLEIEEQYVRIEIGK